MVDTYVVMRIPITYLAVYPELYIALPSIEMDFFRNPLTEEERKEAINFCPRCSIMNYQLPPLNDSASATVKKKDSFMRRIQANLAQATRHIYHYVHMRIQENLEISTKESKILFTNTIRVLLSDIATTVTQNRMDNPQKSIELPGKPVQLVVLEK
ncbi:hypothetical protein AYI68_g4162 [Smittium mucronatum]|uniref:Uncharacterized protein n=1 Tax=Smittium mucronatum TaxID=133383 RepID=A0A1R0GY03_9FUNG|nr:hypothetical protein AYI68_g4162 [Smittium mucronatum]